MKSLYFSFYTFKMPPRPLPQHRCPLEGVVLQAPQDLAPYFHERQASVKFVQDVNTFRTDVLIHTHRRRNITEFALVCNSQIS